MQKKVLLLALALLFVGCASKEVASSDSKAQIVEDRPPNSDSSCKYGDLSIEEIIDKRADSGLLKVQIKGINRSDRYYQLQYRVVWLDRDGFVIPSLLSKWQSAPAYASSPFYVNAIAPSPKAKRYRVYIRKNQKEIECQTQQENYLDQQNGY